MDNFKTDDVSNMTFSGTSLNTWSITPPTYTRLKDELQNYNSTLMLIFHAECRRYVVSQLAIFRDSNNSSLIIFSAACCRPQKEVDSSSRRVEQFFNRPLSAEERAGFLDILAANDAPLGNPRPSVKLDFAFPRFLFAQRNNLRNASGNLAQPYTYVNISASLQKSPALDRQWWVLEEIGIADPPCYGTLNNRTDDQMSFHSPSRSLSIIVFNERVSDNILGKIFSSYGIIGMYAAYIFVASRLLRMIYSDISYQISLQELPHVDRLLNLCHDIYLVRENGKLRLEEQLFAKLIFLYRSSETMIKWTRHPKWLIDKFTDNPPENSPEGERGGSGPGGGTSTLSGAAPTATQPRLQEEEGEGVHTTPGGQNDGDLGTVSQERRSRSRHHPQRSVVASGDPRSFRTSAAPTNELRRRPAAGTSTSLAHRSSRSPRR